MSYKIPFPEIGIRSSAHKSHAARTASKIRSVSQPKLFLRRARTLCVITRLESPAFEASRHPSSSIFTSPVAPLIKSSRLPVSTVRSASPSGSKIPQSSTSVCPSERKESSFLFLKCQSGTRHTKACTIYARRRFCISLNKFLCSHAIWRGGREETTCDGSQRVNVEDLRWTKWSWNDVGL
jgi:hypothetical protein